MWNVFSLAGRAELPFIICLAPRAGKMNQIACCDWLPEWARWSHLAHSGLPAVSRKQNFSKSHIINPLLTKFAQSRWLDIGLVLFFKFIDLDFVSVHKHAKKRTWPISNHLDWANLVNNPYLQKLYCQHCLINLNSTNLKCLTTIPMWQCMKKIHQRKV